MAFSVANTGLEGIDPTFITGVLFTRASSRRRLHPGQTLALAEGAQAALELGRPGTEGETQRTNYLDGHHGTTATSEAH